MITRGCVKKFQHYKFVYRYAMLFNIPLFLRNMQTEMSTYMVYLALKNHVLVSLCLGVNYKLKV